MSIQNVPNSVANPATRLPVPAPKPNGGEGLIRQVGDLFRDVLSANLRPQQRNEVQRATQTQSAATQIAPAANSFGALVERSGASSQPSSVETLLNAVTELVKVVRDLVQSVFQSIGALGTANGQASTAPTNDPVPATAGATNAPPTAATPATMSLETPAPTQPGTQQLGTEPTPTTGTSTAEVVKNSLLNRTISWLQDGDKVEAVVKELSSESSIFKFVADKIDLPKAAARLGGFLGAFFG